MKTSPTKPISKNADSQGEQIETYVFIEKYYFGTKKNDIFDLSRFFNQGANADINATLYGGLGDDRLDLKGFNQADIFLSFDSTTNHWTLSYAFTDRQWCASLNSVERVTFAKNVKLQLSASQAVLYGTNGNDKLALSPDLTMKVSIQAGAGNDVMSISPRVSRDSSALPTHVINGGSGKDNLLFYGLPSAYAFEIKDAKWLVRDFNGHAYVSFMNVETASFSDGTSIRFNPHSYVVKGGNFNLDIGGTDGADTFIGTNRDDTFRASAGADIYDLSKSGNDIVYLDLSSYHQGITKITVYGFSSGDKLLNAATGESLLGRLVPPDKGFLVGSLKLYNEKATIDVSFLAAPAKS